MTRNGETNWFWSAVELEHLDFMPVERGESQTGEGLKKRTQN